MHPSTLIGLKVGGFELIQELGQGTTSVTFLAMDASGKPAIAKRLLDRLANTPGVTGKFLSVVDQSAKLRMKRFVAVVTGQKCSTDGVFLLREYVEGRTLSDYLRMNDVGSLSLSQIAEDISEALRSLSLRGVVHGGLHPGNVIVQPDGRAKLTDFGTSLIQVGGRPDTDYPLNALRYVSPEQWRGEVADVRSDIYALALLFARLRSPTEVFPATDYRALQSLVLAGLLSGEPILAAALHPSPARRLSDLDKLRDGLKNLLQKTQQDDNRNADDARLEKERLEKERLEKERLEKERLEKERLEKERLEKERLEKERLEKERLEKERLEKERLEKERLEKERLEKERLEKERQKQGGEAPAELGNLGSLFDVKAQRNLLEKSPPPPWMLRRGARQQEFPLLAVNSGRGLLALSIHVVGRGISVSPATADIPPGQRGSFRVDVSSESDQFVNLIFRWPAANGLPNHEFVLKIVQFD